MVWLVMQYLVQYYKEGHPWTLDHMVNVYWLRSTEVILQVWRVAS